MSPETEPTRVLFLCTHNSARSQMAEALLRLEGGGRFAAFSAGTEPRPVHPLAVQVMKELGVDLSTARPRSVDEFLGQPFDYVITVCDQAAERCPVFPGPTTRLHWSFEDPSAATGSEAERLAVFRRVRDGLRERVRELVEAVR